MVSCHVFGGDFEETYLAVMNSKLGKNMLIFEAMHPGEEVELRFWWPEKKAKVGSTNVRQVEPGQVPVQG